MDPSIVKLLEEDEDESMHSGAAVEAFQAALNRHIEGDATISQPSDSDSVLSQGSNQTSNQSFALWQSASTIDSTSFQSQQGQEAASQQAQSSTGLEQRQPITISEMQQSHPNDVPHECSSQPSFPLQQKQSQDNRQHGVTGQIPSHLPQTGMKNSESSPISMFEVDQTNNQESESQYLKLQKISNQQASAAEPLSNPVNRGKQVPFALLLPAILPQLDKDRSMQLQTLYGKLKKSEISKDGFVRLMRSVVGDQMLKIAVNKLQLKMSSEQFQMQSQAAARQNNPGMPSDSASQFTSPRSYTQLHQQSSISPVDPSHAPSAAVHQQIDTRYQSTENDAQKSREMERQSDSHIVPGVQVSSLSSGLVNQDRERSSIPIQGLNKQQQHMQFPPTSFPMYGSNSIHQYSGPNVTAAGSSLKPPSHDPQITPIYHQNMVSTPIGGSIQANPMNGPKLEKQYPQNDKKRVHGGSLSQFSNNSSVQHSSVPWPISTTSGPSSMAYVKPGSIEQHAEQHQRSHISTPQGMVSGLIEQKSTVPLIPKEEMSEKQSSSVSPLTPGNVVPPRSITAKLNLASTVQSASPAGVNTRTPSKKPAVGQKKPAEAPGSSPPPPSKKQKVSGGFLDQGIDQLNDVTAVSGVNLREEEEQLFSGPKEDSRVSEASRRAMQEEEERHILQKIPLQKKLAEIMAKCDLKNMSNDVERCLSLCVEERMRGLIRSLIRLSKQRVGMEKSMHRTIVTSDIKQQIMMINRKARGEWEKKQAEVEKLRRVNEPESETAVEGDKDKDESRAKSVKVNKEDDDKMRATAANVAARAAVGGDDMLSKWQLMAEQARQKREGGVSDGVSSSQAGKDVNHRPLSTTGRNTKEDQDAERGGPLSPSAGIGTMRKSGRNQDPRNNVACSISFKDVIAVLEREPQMSKSVLIYRLYEKIRLEPAVE